MRLNPLISTCKLGRVNMTSHRLCLPLSLKPKHLLSLLRSNGPLQIPQPKVEEIPKILKWPLCRNVASNRASHTYSIVDNLAQSSTTKLTLEVLQSYPSQKKALLTTLGVVGPFDNHLIFFPVYTSKHPPLLSSIAFQIPVPICNATISQCIIDKAASTCVMYVAILKQIKSPEFSPSTITLRASD